MGQIKRKREKVDEGRNRESGKKKEGEREAG